MFEIERVRDRERKIGYSPHKGTETLVRDRERFEIEGVRDRESQLYVKFVSAFEIPSYSSKKCARLREISQYLAGLIVF